MSEIPTLLILRVIQAFKVQRCKQAPPFTISGDQEVSDLCMIVLGASRANLISIQDNK